MYNKYIFFMLIQATSVHSWVQNRCFGLSSIKSDILKYKTSTFFKGVKLVVITLGTVKREVVVRLF